VQARKYDAGTAVWAASLNGANNMRIVRVTDGTDVAATAVIGGTGVTITAKYTGSLGNSISVVLATGSQANSWKVTVTLSPLNPEVFDNIAPGLSGNAVWLAIAAAINNGTSGLRGASQLIVAAAGVSVTAPVAGTTPLLTGSDGAATITSTVLIGADGTSRTGMYALRSTGTSIALLSDCDTSSSWTLQVAFGLSEGIYMIGVGPAGDTIANAVTAKGTAGIDSYIMKLMFGDWCYFNDTANNIPNRLVSPQGFIAGRLSALSPEQSSLNKPLYGIVGTQKSSSTSSNNIYSSADLQTLSQAGIDVITNPIPIGFSFGSRIGANTSSNQVINGDNYPRLTNFIAYTLSAAMGTFIGRLQSPLVRDQARGAINTFLANMWDQGMLGDVTDVAKQPFSVVLDNSNNTPSRVALGYMQVDVRVTYLSVITKLLVNVEGGQSVRVSVASIAPQ
jgi:hypothetical protein